MRNILAALLIALGTTAFAQSGDSSDPAPTTSTGPPPATEYTDIATPIVHVGQVKNLGGEDEKQFFGCSGFYIGNGIVVTAGHCLVSARKAEGFVVRFDNTEKFSAKLGALSDPDSGFSDFGILRIDVEDAKDLPKAPAAKLDCSGVPLKTGDVVKAVGYPYDYSNAGEVMITTWGKVSAGKYAPDAGYWAIPLIRHNLAIDPGSSGGALYNEGTGLIVGITVGVTPKNRVLSFSQPITAVCNYLGLPQKEDVNAEKVSKP